MKTNKLCTLFFSVLLGNVSVGYTSAASAGPIPDVFSNALEALIPDARERLITNCRAITQPGAYSLIRNLSSTGDCLIIKANHVTIDLNGFVISGTEHTGRAISGDIEQGLHLRNGTITGFNTAIEGSPKYSTLNEMSIIDNDNGVSLGDGARITNTIFGEAFEGNLAALTTGKGATIKDNTFFHNSTHLEVGSGSIVVNNVGIEGGEDSFNIGEKALVIGNNVTDTFDEGIRVGPNSNIINNNAFGNGGFFDLEFEKSNVHGNSADHYEGVIPGCDYTDTEPCRVFHNLFLFTN